ncbi:MAG TPA: DNA-directed RNA polymerase subunit beta' [Candidatus Paceibacterota bacterium]|nr:DNA-directed RNA polymerase subunit beta' [Candidatus Paceibacterota bacterium]
MAKEQLHETSEEVLEPVMETKKVVKKPHSMNDFDAISLRLASPEKILEWSHGEVLKPETINYRTQRSERNGLFCERIFGPEKDYECYCGKYKGVRYRGIVCEKCGVEITRSIVRRERMGHIELAAPVSHIWFLRGIPSKIGLLLNAPVSEIEKVIYFAGYIVTSVNETERARLLKELDTEYKMKLKSLQDDKAKEKLKETFTSTKRELTSLVEGLVLDEAVYHRYSYRYASVFEAGIGAEAIYEIFHKTDLEKLKNELEEKLSKAGATERVKLEKRLGLVKSMIQANLRPEWMFLKNIAVTPPALRPMVALDGGRHATSDVNDLYRRVINRNNRLKKLKDLAAPEVILRNEKRILQEAVDALLDNSIRKQSASAAVSQSQKRALKSISDVLKGKQGLFRQNLLGKRVDYSGRSVIVVGPSLKLNQCGLPKRMALELFRPFVISKLLQMELAHNIRGANRLVDEEIPEVWAILEEVIKDKYVLLNRAPTLHRLGIQAFNPVLTEGKAIQVHPMVCSAFNADFDGDQMAVHVPLSDEAQAEAKHLMAADKNILKPANGEPIVSAKLDIVLGCYWMTKIIDGQKGEGKYFATPNHAITAYDFDEVDFRAKIKVLATDSPRYEKFGGEVFETSVGRLLFNSILPKDFPYMNEEINNKSMGNLIDDIIEKYGISGSVKVLDKIKDFGFKYVTRSGVTWGLDEVMVPEGKKAIIAAHQERAEKVLEEFNEGLLSEDERFRKTIEIWQSAISEIEKIIPSTLKEHGPVYDMLKSGARGSISSLVQMAGMKGLIVNPQGKIIDFPVVPSNKEGLSPIEYFITTHGSRKGLADTALQTAKAGYLTRRLVYVADNAIIREDDCGDTTGIMIRKQSRAGMEVPFVKMLKGYTLAAPVKDESGKKIFDKGKILSKYDAEAIEAAGVEEVNVYSPLSCKALHGICKKCYGLDLGRGAPVKEGETVGIVAAQAIGEPGTQLTMRTFHSGGIAQVGGDITQGLPRVEEIFEARAPRMAALVAKAKGQVTEVTANDRERIIKVLSEIGEKRDAKGAAEIEYVTDVKRVSRVRVGEQVEAGDLLTDGSADIAEVFKYGGKAKAQEYIIAEISKVYELQGASISRKHIEVIVRQMFSRRRITAAGDTNFTLGEVVEYSELMEENKRVSEEGGEPAKGATVVLGISDVSLTTKSFLSAASFQNTSRVLIDTAVHGAEDDLTGLKENVIIGRLIPAGTGLRGTNFEDEVGE